jgi:hypothetical protein
MNNKKLKESLTIGTKIKIGKKYAEEVGGLDAGEIITLVEGYFEYDNGLYIEDQAAPSVWDDYEGDFDSIYHLFGNNFEYWYDCEIVTDSSPAQQ